MKRTETTLKDKVYDLSHLNRYTWLFTIPEKNGKPEQKYTILVDFGSHCFTKGHSEKHDQELNYTERNDLRTFCIDRHKESFELLSYIKAMETSFVFLNKHKGQKQNYMRVPVASGNYEIYFKLTKSSSNNADLNLFVQSAFFRTHGENRKLGKIRFAIAVYNTANNKPVKAPPKHR